MTSHDSSTTPTEKQLTIDQEFKALIPPLTTEERELLESSLKSEGCRDALVVWKDHNILIDGHNRYELCSKSNLPYQTIEREFETREDVIVWIARNQMARRNITQFSRDELALAIKEALETKGKLNMSQGLSVSDKPHNTQAEIAKLANTSTGGIAQSEVIRKKAPKSIKEKARNGDISRDRAYKITNAVDKLPEADRETVITICDDNDEKINILHRLYVNAGKPDTNGTYDEILRANGFQYGKDMEKWLDYREATIEEIRKALDTVKQWHIEQTRDKKREAITAASVIISDVIESKEPKYKTGDIVYIGSHILICEDNTSQLAKDEIAKHAPVALAFCDPPYNAGVALWDSGDFTWSQDYLSEFADIVAVTPGIGNIPDFMRNTAMPYKWSTSTFISNGMTRGALGFGNWIYTALFSKQQSIHRNSQDVYTVTINATDSDELAAKRQKPPMYLSWIFKLLTEEGETIVDVFGGSGSSILVANNLKRRCICIEKDVETFNAMVARIQTALTKNAEAA